MVEKFHDELKGLKEEVVKKVESSEVELSFDGKESPVR